MFHITRNLLIWWFKFASTC